MKYILIFVTLKFKNEKKSIQDYVQRKNYT